MNIKSLTIIIVLSLYCIFGFEKITYSLNKASHNTISELKILKYLPKDNKAFFISNAKISNIANNIQKNYNIKDQDKLILMKNSILAYLGIDLGKNKLEDIYNNELTISTYDRKEKDIDDVLIIFKIHEKKDIDDILNLTNKIDETNKLIKIFREDKLSYLKYIYRTNDNYILVSSNKFLILEALDSNNISHKTGKDFNNLRENLNNFKNENNVLLTKNIETNKLLNNKNYLQTKDEYIATLFNFNDKKVNLKSYLINNKKNLDIMSYNKIVQENKSDKNIYQVYIYNDSLNYNKYLDLIKLNSFEKAILKELYEKLEQDILFLVSKNNWIIIYDKNNLSIKNINLLNDFNKNSLENNNNIYTIYSKDILKKEQNIIKQFNYKKIFLIETGNLNFISNNLLNDVDIDFISKEFFKNKGDSHTKYFLNNKIDLKNPYPIKTNENSYLKNINYFFKNVIDLSIIEFKAIIKQSIPETTPIYYEETNLKIF